jgi:hypothetical protein
MNTNYILCVRNFLKLLLIIMKPERNVNRNRLFWFFRMTLSNKFYYLLGKLRFFFFLFNIIFIWNNYYLIVFVLCNLICLLYTIFKDLIYECNWHRQFHCLKWMIMMIMVFIKKKKISEVIIIFFTWNKL